MGDDPAVAQLFGHALADAVVGERRRRCAVRETYVRFRAARTPFSRLGLPPQPKSAVIRALRPPLNVELPKNYRAAEFSDTTPFSHLLFLSLVPVNVFS
jgi:hypothetical protein